MPLQRRSLGGVGQLKIIYEPGDPVRLKGKRGLFRFVMYVPDGTFTAEYANVINPRRETDHVVPVADLEMPPKTATPKDVESHPGVERLSRRAHNRGNR